MELSLEIWILIHNFLDRISKLRLIWSYSRFYYGLKIYELNNYWPDKLKEIFKTSYLSNLTYLNAFKYQGYNLKRDMNKILSPTCLPKCLKNWILVE